MSDRVIACERAVNIVVLSKKEMIFGMREHYIWEDITIVAQFSVIKDLFCYCSNMLRNMPKNIYSDLVSWNKQLTERKEAARVCFINSVSKTKYLPRDSATLKMNSNLAL